MAGQKIHILGEEEIVSMLGLLGLEGTIVGNEEDLLKEFSELVNDPSMGIMIIGIPLKNETIDFLLEFKQKNKIPLIFILPDIFKPNIEKDDIILNKILYAIGDVVLR